MKKTLKTTFLVALMLVIIAFNVMPVFAAAQTGAPDPRGYTGKEAEVGSLETIGGQVITIVSVAGSIIAVIVLVVLGIKYMMGSAEEKAEYKKTLLPYIIGAAFVFAASALAGIIYNFAHSINAG